ncbi:hypothetical protein [Bradyrhizobium embrapense]
MRLDTISAGGEFVTAGSATATRLDQERRTQRRSEAGAIGEMSG